MSKFVSIIIVSVGRKESLKYCLDSVRIQTHQGLEAIVIDNSLNPDFGKEISRIYPEIKLYSSQSNLFYGPALNKGIELGQGSFILCLNDDVILDKRFIEEALEGFKINERIGMVSGKILRIDKKTIDSTGLFLSLWRAPQERGYGLGDKGQYEKEGYVFGVTGAAAFYRRKMLEDIKMDSDYFDRDYRMFCEDLDIAWRGQNFGWKAYYVPRAIAYHIRGATVRKDYGINKPFARRYLSCELHLELTKNRYLTLIKNESYLGLILHLPFILFYEMIAWGYIMLFRPPVIKRFFLNLNYLKSAFKKRKLIEDKKGTYLKPIFSSIK